MAKSKAKDEPKEESGKATLTVDPETTSIGAPVRIRVENTDGPITAKYTEMRGLGQTLYPDRDGIAMAVFAYTGEVEVSAMRASGKTRVKQTLMVR